MYRVKSTEKVFKSLHNDKSLLKKTQFNSAKASGLSNSLNKKLGQHLLINQGVLEKILRAAEIKSTDTVLEIGPGTGNLTMKLLGVARRVRAFDIDERMVGDVRRKALSMGYTNLDVFFGDALRSEFGSFDVCVANLPYNISSPFIFKLIAHRPVFRLAILMFQKEFADRLLAKPNDKCYSRLSINVQIYCKVEVVCQLGAKSFTPPPLVDSTVVKLIPKWPSINIDFKEWDGLLRICFMRKRKTLRSVFMVSSVLKLLEENLKIWNEQHNYNENLPIKDVVESVLQASNCSNKRAVNLGINDYLELLLAFHEKNIHFQNVGSNIDCDMQ